MLRTHSTAKHLTHQKIFHFQFQVLKMKLYLGILIVVLALLMLPDKGYEADILAVSLASSPN